MRTQDEFELKNKMKYVHKIYFIPSVDQVGSEMEIVSRPMS